MRVQSAAMSSPPPQAPDVPGKYVSYWRLHDGNEFFGSSIWVECVAPPPSPCMC